MQYYSAPQFAGLFLHAYEADFKGFSRIIKISLNHLFSFSYLFRSRFQGHLKNKEN
jgi:hypothetical protein